MTEPLIVFTIQTVSNGTTWHLRGTTWSSDPERASRFETKEAANAALLKIKPFTKPALFKKAWIVRS